MVIIMRVDSHWLICLNTYSSVAGTVWEELGVVVLLEQLFLGVGFDFFKTQYHFRLACWLKVIDQGMSCQLSIHCAIVDSTTEAN